MATEPDGFYTAPEHGWTCFHCGETFMHENVARAHFGANPEAMPGCQLRMQPGERPLLRHIRFLEGELAKLRHDVCDEDTEIHRVMHGMVADHAIALIREEEKGYAKGLKDYTKVLEALKLVALYVYEDQIECTLCHRGWGDKAPPGHKEDCVLYGR